jgi:uncharacterized protein
MIMVILLSIVVVAVVMIAMAVGTIFSNRCLRGSCGGPEVLGPSGESLSCETCPLRKRQQESGSSRMTADQEARRSVS